MGHTHYFTTKRRPTDRQWAAFTRDVRAILGHPAVAPRVCFERDEPDRPPQVDEEAVQFNGRGEEGHETLYIPRAAHRTFCKTGGPGQMEFGGDSWGKAYDSAVCAVLLAANRHLGAEVSSDGEWDEPGWSQARALYGRAAGHIARCPWPVRQCAKCPRVFKAEGHGWGGREVCAECGGGSFFGRPYRASLEKIYGKPLPKPRGRGLEVCYRCGCTKKKYIAPTTWCYYCSNGYATKEDARVDLQSRWSRVLAQIEEQQRKRGRHLQLVSDPPPPERRGPRGRFRK